MKLEAAFGGPLSDRTAARVAILYNDIEGYLNNLYPLDEFGAGTFGGPNGNSPGSGAGADMGGGETFAARGSLLFEINDDVTFSVSVNVASSEMPTRPYQSKATTAVYDGTGPVPGGPFPGELINVINLNPNDARYSICAPGGIDNGTDCGADHNVDGMPDDFANNMTGAPGPDSVADAGRFGNNFLPSPGADFFGYIDPDGEDFNTSGDLPSKTTAARTPSASMRGLNGSYRTAYC